MKQKRFLTTLGQALLLSLLISTVGLGVKALAQKATQPLETVNQQVDLNRYTGKWYEIALIPNSFERNCIANTTAEYTLQSNGHISVVNSCDKANGKRQTSMGDAKVVAPDTNAKLRVSFLNLPLLGWQFWAAGDYWILDLAPDYSTVIIGEPSRKYGWILARTPQISMETLQTLKNKITSLGYDPCQFQMKPQKNGANTQESLCAYLQAEQK